MFKVCRLGSKGTASKSYLGVIKRNRESRPIPNFHVFIPVTLVNFTFFSKRDYFATRSSMYFNLLCYPFPFLVVGSPLRSKLIKFSRIYFIISDSQKHSSRICQANLSSSVLFQERNMISLANIA